MVKKCAVLRCPVKARTKIGQFSFPVKRDQCWKWVQACGRGPEFRPTPHSRVCEIHFAEDDFKPDEGRKRRRLKNGVIPSLNLGTGDLTEEALRVVNIQREADLAALETAKENLERSRREEEEARLARESDPTHEQQPVHFDPLTDVTGKTRQMFQIQVEPLSDREGLKISLPQKLAKNPKRIARVFRDANVLELIKFHSCKSLPAYTKSGKKKRNPRDSTFSFTICPVLGNEVSDTKPSTSSEYDTRIGDRSVDQLLSQAWNQNFSGTKKRRIMPPWFRQGDSAAGRLPPAELAKLKPVPVSKALHLLFDTGQPDLPQPPPALPPINAKLIFVDRTNLTIPDMVEPYSEDGQLMSHLEVEEGENLPTVKLEVPHELPSGPIAILDPDGLKREVEHWRSQVEEMQKKNYDLEVKLAHSKNEKRKLQLKLKAMVKARDRELQSQTKKKLLSTAKVVKLKTELSNLRKFRRQVVSNEKSKKLKRARSSEQDNAKEYIVDHINSDKSLSRKRVMPNEKNEAVVVETDSFGRSRNITYHATFDQSNNLILAPDGTATIVTSLPQNVIDESTTTVMLPSEAIYTTENGEYQHIEIITMNMDGLEPTWRRVNPE